MVKKYSPKFIIIKFGCFYLQQISFKFYIQGVKWLCDLCEQNKYVNSALFLQKFLGQFHLSTTVNYFVLLKHIRENTFYKLTDMSTIHIFTSINTITLQ